MDMEKERAKPIRELGCCCCGSSTRGRQWWNRDTGYGICVECLEFCGVAPGDNYAESYGYRGVHFAVE